MRDKADFITRYLRTREGQKQMTNTPENTIQYLALQLLIWQLQQRITAGEPLLRPLLVEALECLDDFTVIAIAAGLNRGGK
jgi:hypothetical protein